MMKARPRQIDQNKHFICIDSVEKFHQAEGQEHDVTSTSSILTPDMLAALAQQSKSQQQPKKTVQPITSTVSYASSEYLRYMHPLYPNPNKYELSDADIQFLNNFNAKLLAQNINIQIKADELEEFLENLDLKSGKLIVIEYEEFLKSNSDPLPQSILLLDYSFQQELYVHWRKYRGELQRTLLRSIMYPDSQESNPHLAFRSRMPQTDRTMKLRRGNNNQQKGLQDLDSVSQKVCQLKEEFNKVQILLKNVLLREQGVEVERRVSFGCWAKRYLSELQAQPYPSELKYFNQSCFLKDKALISEDYFDLLSKETYEWKKKVEQSKQEIEEISVNYRKLENSFRNISLQHHQTANIQQQESEEFVYVRPIRDTIREKNYVNKEFLEERNVTVAKFLATCYLLSRPLGLTFDRVINQTMTLNNFAPASGQKIVPAPFAQTVPVNGGPETFQIPQVNQAPRRNFLIPFMPLKLKSSNLIYRMPINHEMIAQGLSKKAQIKSQNTTLQGQYDYFERKSRWIMQLSDQDGQLMNELVEDDRHEEEELKLLRKKIKLGQNKQLTLSNGNSQIK